MKEQLTAQLQISNTHPISPPNANSGKLVQNFLTALNNNYNKNLNQLSRSSTNTSNQPNSNQIRTKYPPSNSQYKNNPNDFFQCQEQIQTQNNFLVSKESKELKYISQQLKKIKIDPLYFVKHQGIRANSRAILMDWITELCEQFRFLRTTCSQTKTLIDVYLSSVSNVPISRLQLVGITCLLLISKLQQSLPKTLIEMAYATACLYNVDQIHRMQIEIMKQMQSQVKFLTYQTCINFIINQWQKFQQVETDPCQLNIGYEELPINYLEENLRWMLDVIMLDSESLNYNYLKLSISLLVLLLGYGYSWFSFQEIQYSFIYNCRYLFNSPTYFLNKIQKFLNKLKLALCKISSSLQFVSSYFFLVNMQETPRFTQVHNNQSLYYIRYRKQLIKQKQLIFQ